MEDSTKSDGTSTDDDKIKCDLFNLAEKLRIELHVKDQELAEEKQKNQKLSTDLALEKARADNLETKLDSAQELIEDYQMSLWECFQCPTLSYCIETQSGSSNGEYLYLSAEYHEYYLRAGVGGEFKFTKNSDGTFTIYSMVQEGNSSQKKYLQTYTNSSSSRVECTANKDNAGKFVLIFHEQNQKAGLMVDICTLNWYFLCMGNGGYVAANSRTAPASTDKFMITPNF